MRFGTKLPSSGTLVSKRVGLSNIYCVSIFFIHILLNISMLVIFYGRIQLRTQYNNSGVIQYNTLIVLITDLLPQEDKELKNVSCVSCCIHRCIILHVKKTLSLLFCLCVRQQVN